MLGIKPSRRAPPAAASAPTHARDLEGPAAPGYMLNLTPAQRTALAELWVHLLHLFAQPMDTPVTSTKLPPPRSPSGTLLAAAGGAMSQAPSTSSLSAKATGNDSSAPPPVADALTSRSPTQPVTVQEVRQDLWLACQHLHPDAFLLRFLRARKFDVAKAYAMLLECVLWRVRAGVAEVLALGEAAIPANQFQGKAYFWGHDKIGRPALFVNARLHDKSAQGMDVLQRHTVWLIESGRLFLPDDVETVSVVFNLAGFGLSNMDNDMVSFIIKCLEARYPESLGQCLVANAPWIFTPIWKLIRGWLDPVVSSKIEFVDSAGIQKYIPPTSIPAELAPASTKDASPVSSYAWSYAPPAQADVDAHKQKLADKQAVATLLEAKMEVATRLENLSRTWAEAWLKEYKPAALEGTAAAKSPNDEEVDIAGLLERTQAQRAELVKGEHAATWWAYDDYVRFATPWHRYGVVQRSGKGIDWSKLATA